MDIQKVINKHSDYVSEDPYWINLPYGIKNETIAQEVSNSLNEFFEKNGPDACEAFDAFQSCLMSRNTAERALKYAFRKNKDLTKNLDLEDSIDGGMSIESDGRENDPVTGKLLHCIPINEDSTIEELNCLKEQSKIKKQDWVFIDYAYNSFGYENEEVLAAIVAVIKKHHHGKIEA